MQPVLGLVEDRRLRAVDDLLGDLLAVVRGKAVQDERLLAGLAHELRVDAVAGEVAPAPLVLGLLTHRRPDVGVEDVRAGDRSVHVRRQLHRAARFARPLARDGDRSLAAARMPAGVAATTCIPNVAAPTSSEAQTLLPSPT